MRPFPSGANQKRKALNICSLIFVVVFAASGAHPGYAQNSNTSKDQTIAAIKREIDALNKKQQIIIDQLDELKRLIEANSGAISVGVQVPSTTSISGDPFRGDNGARVVLIEYADFECPFCGEYMKDVFPQLLTNYIKTGYVKYVYRDFPLSMHPHAMTAARASHCAAEQGKFWEMHDKLFANQSALGDDDIVTEAQELGLDKVRFSQCLSTDKYNDDIRRVVTNGQKMGIEGTPTFLLGTVGPDGEIKVTKSITGAYPYAVFKSDLDELLAQKNP